LGKISLKIDQLFLVVRAFSSSALRKPSYAFPSRKINCYILHFGPHAIKPVAVPLLPAKPKIYFTAYRRTINEINQAYFRFMKPSLAKCIAGF